MKQISLKIVSVLLMVSCCMYCKRLNHNNVNLTISESDNYFTILAQYNGNNQRQVDKCIDKHFGKAANTSFINTSIDGNVTLNNGTTFYIVKKPGFLNIKLDKEKNSTAAYHELKSLGNDLKAAIQ